MKKLPILFLFSFLISVQIFGQEEKTEFDGHKWNAPYQLTIPEGWGVERFQIPINFAPEISYQGIEDIRFTPGWGKSSSEEYWTYAFLWYLDGGIKTNAKIIEENLKAYYTGLIKSNTKSAGTVTEKTIPVTTSFTKKPTDKADLETYSGSIEMFDYMQRKPIILNCIVHLKFCEDENKTILFYELSPKPFTHNNWEMMNALWLTFKCKK